MNRHTEVIPSPLNNSNWIEPESEITIFDFAISILLEKYRKAIQLENCKQNMRQCYISLNMNAADKYHTRCKQCQALTRWNCSIAEVQSERARNKK